MARRSKTDQCTDGVEYISNKLTVDPLVNDSNFNATLLSPKISYSEADANPDDYGLRTKLIKQHASPQNNQRRQADDLNAPRMSFKGFWICRMCQRRSLLSSNCLDCGFAPPKRFNW